MSSFLLDWLSRLAQISGDARQALFNLARERRWSLDDFAWEVINARVWPQKLRDALTPFEIAAVHRAWLLDFGHDTYFEQRSWVPPFREGVLTFDDPPGNWSYNNLRPTCPHCGSTCMADSNYCRKCGEALIGADIFTDRHGLSRDGWRSPQPTRRQHRGSCAYGLVEPLPVSCIVAGDARRRGRCRCHSAPHSRPSAQFQRCSGTRAWWHRGVWDALPPDRALPAEVDAMECGRAAWPGYKPRSSSFACWDRGAAGIRRSC